MFLLQKWLTVNVIISIPRGIYRKHKRYPTKALSYRNE